MKRLAGILAAATALALASSAQATTVKQADRLMGYLAQHQTHSAAGDSVDTATLLQEVDSGRRIYVICGPIADLGYLVARYHRIPARHVHLLARGPGVMGHSVLELYVSGHWVLYDLDQNQRAVDKQGRPIGVLAQQAAGHDRRWHKIAHDYIGPINRISRSLYDRVFATVQIETAPDLYAYHEAQRDPFVEANASVPVYWVSARKWSRIDRNVSVIF